MQQLAVFLREGMIIVNVAKGLDEDPETGKLLTMLDVIESKLPQALDSKIPLVAVGGPSIAKEVAERIPTEVIFASKDLVAARYCRRVFTTPVYKAKITTDVIGVELCAALKNVFAVAVGMCNGIKDKMNTGVEMHNAKATLLSEAAVELAKIVRAMAGREETVLGPAGIGDLYVTTVGGRTCLFGEMLGSGLSPGEALEEMKERHLTVEAYPTAEKVYKLAQALDKSGRLKMNDLPLLKQIQAVLFEGKAAKAAIWDYFAAL
jgi:glycerol-3-phosphate dehydrogenase (NAD(P)+)